MLNIFRCPSCGGSLSSNGDALTCTQCAAVYPVVNSIPRFVP